MPEISRFLGIVIRMYFKDHGPPHCHATYGERECRLLLDPVDVLDGNLPPRVLALVVEWASLHQGALIDNWCRLQSDEPSVRIPPLE